MTLHFLSTIHLHCQYRIRIYNLLTAYTPASKPLCAAQSVEIERDCIEITLPKPNFVDYIIWSSNHLQLNVHSK